MWLQLRLASGWSHRNWGPWWHQDFQLEARNTSLSPCAQCMWDSLWLCHTHSLREAITRACGPPETSVAMISWQPHTSTSYMKGNRHNYCWEEKSWESWFRSEIQGSSQFQCFQNTHFWNTLYLTLPTLFSKETSWLFLLPVLPRIPVPRSQPYPGTSQVQL